MIARTGTRKVATVAYSANNTVRTQLTGVTGRIKRLWLELGASFTVTTAGTNYAQARNPGTLVPQILLMLNGTVVLKQGAWNDWIDRAYAMRKLPAESAASAAAATYPIASRIELPFNLPMGSRGVDSILQLGPDDRLDLIITWADDTALVADSTTQSFATDPTIDVIADMEAYLGPNAHGGSPLGRYTEVVSEHAIGAAAVADFQDVQLVTAPGREYHHLILVCEDQVANTGRTLVSCLTDVTLQQQGGGNQSQPVGIKSGLELQHIYNQHHRLVDGVRTGVYPIHFPGDNDGRITYGLDSTNLDDLRFLLNVADPGASGFVRCLQGTFERF
jgi:hypothetical protein